MEYSAQRMYTRYPFYATAEIMARPGALIPAKVTNISYGGCRLLTEGRLQLGSPVLVRISTPSDAFEADAKVVHSSSTDAGLMFGNVPAQSLFVLRKWIEGMKEPGPRSQ